jgi:chaperonin cofactor prefoldin
MSEAVIVALITGVFAVIAQLLIAKQSSKELYAKLDKESELSDARLDAKLEKHQAVTDTKIEELTREVREHNNFARRVPVLEEKVANLEKKG